jgi:MoaA/NifB/PqqE/SkfB family radical SAM enzyme
MVARKGRFSRWFGANVLRLYSPPSLVSRQNALQKWAAVKVRGELPTLYHFDVHLTDHCNLNCKGCVHFSNICKQWFVDPEKFADDMRVMSQRVNVAQIFLLGGEPLLHPQIDALVRTARRFFPKTRICVVTNGLLLMKMKDSFWRTLAEENIVLICEAYPIELPMDEIREAAASFGVTLEWTSQGGRFYKLPIDLEGTQSAEDSFRRCSGITNCPLYRDGRLYPCAYPPYVDAFTERFGLDGPCASDADSISVRDNDGAAIVEFMKRPIPFCRHCDFNHFVEYEWDRSKREIDEWTVSR